jgi:hypothetical protein
MGHSYVPRNPRGQQRDKIYREALRLELADMLIAMLVGSPNLPYDRAEIRGVESAGRTLGVRVLLLSASNDSDVTAVFANLVEQRAGALLVGGSIPLDSARELIISLAARHSIPTMFYYTSSVGLGGLVSYGPDLSDSYRQTGIYVGRILKGEKPADLPVQRPTRFPLLINLKTVASTSARTALVGLTMKATGLASGTNSCRRFSAAGRLSTWMDYQTGGRKPAQ